MEKKDCKNMRNLEIKLYMETLNNEYEAKKNKIVGLCKEMEELEHWYKDAENELNIRKNIYL